ncbi:MAG: hypothetical protein V4727_14615 [Verrucomicrobiota bacterium]
MRIAKIVARFLVTLFLVESVLSQAVLVGDPEIHPELRNAEKQYMKTSGVILDLCVYEREFQPSERKPEEDKDNPPWTEGTLITRAVVVGVHKGNVKIGTKIEIVETVIDPPKFLKKFRSVVEGELLTFFYYGEELPEPSNGRHILEYNLMYFDRDKDEDVKAFLKSLNPNPNRKNQSEQGGADQPTTAPELKSEGKDKPQPESKVAPR